MTPRNIPGSHVQYRAVGWDATVDGECACYDTGNPRESRREAERDLTAMCESADPPYDDAWIEKRIVGPWEKSKR
jgi:hypothetical protein